MTMKEQEKYGFCSSK